MYFKNFPERLKKARDNTGFTQRDVEKEIGIKQSTLASYEIGRTQPDIDTLGTLADFYGVSVDWLLGTSGGKNNPLSHQNSDRNLAQ